MKTPEFWSRRGPVAMALTPLSLVWLAGSWMRRWRARPYEADIPVICIGNLTAGGSGKTPIVGWLYDRLAARGWNPAILSRGYGGTERGPIWVNGDQHDAAACGDEPLMLAEGREVMVAHDRAAGASRISAGGKHDVILMDDGMQNPHLKRDLTIGVFDGGSGIGNGLVMPAGPLRSRLRSGMAEIDLAIVNGDDEAGIANLLPDGLPAFRHDYWKTERPWKVSMAPRSWPLPGLADQLDSFAASCLLVAILSGRLPLQIITLIHSLIWRGFRKMRTAMVQTLSPPIRTGSAFLPTGAV